MPGAAAPRHPPPDPSRVLSAGRDSRSAGGIARATGADGLVALPCGWFVRADGSIGRSRGWVGLWDARLGRAGMQIVRSCGSSGLSDGSMV